MLLANPNTRINVLIFADIQDHYIKMKFVRILTALTVLRLKDVQTKILIVLTQHNHIVMT